MEKKQNPTTTSWVVVPRREKFVGERIEEAKLRLREAEVYTNAAECGPCHEERRRFADETALCEVHLRQVLGTQT